MNRGHFSLRRYQPADLETLFEIDQYCFPPGIAYSRRDLREFIHLPGATCLVAKSADSAIGFVIAISDELEGHIVTLDVLSDFRRKGIGSALLRAVEAEMAACGVKKISLETATNNQPAIALYEKHGYRIVSVLKGFYLGKWDAYEMQKIL